MRPYQTKLLANAREAVGAGAHAVLCVLATGLGKTRVAVEACVAHARKGGRPLWVAHTRELLGQASDALRARGLEPESTVFVRSIQELSVAKDMPPATMLVIDEAHRAAAESYLRLRESYPNAIVLGLTATPERGDGRGLQGAFDALVTAITIKEAQALGHLVPCEVLSPDRALGPGELAQDPIDAYEAHAAGTSAILFAPTVQIAVQYACIARERGIKAAAVFGEQGTRERDHWVESYRAGEAKLLCSVNALTEGFDAPRTETVILARGFGTAGGFIQAAGRGLRPFEGKARCLLLDLRGVTHVHGLPDEERTYSLDGKAIRRAGDETDVRFCPVCGSPVAGPACELCGHEGEMRLRKPRILGLPIQRFAALRQDSEEAKAERLAKWLGEARGRGFKPGWAFAKYRAVYGAAANGAMVSRARQR